MEEPPGLLARMMVMQDELQLRLEPKFVAAAAGQGIDLQGFYLKENANGLSGEAHEVKDCTNWKLHSISWGQPMSDDQKVHAREEATDCFIFVLNLFRGLGMSEADVFDSYCAKNAVNLGRQASGY